MAVTDQPIRPIHREDSLGTVIVFTFNACHWPGVSAALRATLRC